MKMLLLVASVLIVTVSHAVAESEAAKMAIAETQSTPAARSGKALSDCLLQEVEKAKQIDLSNEEFGKVLVSACHEQTERVRMTLSEAGVDEAKTVDFSLSVIRARAYQTFTGVAKIKKRAN